MGARVKIAGLIEVIGIFGIWIEVIEVWTTGAESESITTVGRTETGVRRVVVFWKVAVIGAGRGIRETRKRGRVLSSQLK